MIVPDLKLYRPESLSEMEHLICDFSQNKKTFRFLAGGTDLIPHLKRGEENPDALLSLRRLGELRGFREEEETLVIGAMTSLWELATCDVILKKLPWLAQTASQVASPQIRNQATLGGNLLANNRCKFFDQGSTNRDCHEACFKAGGDVCHLIPNATRESDQVCRARFVSDLAPMLMIMGAQAVITGSQGQRSILLKDLYSRDGLGNVKLPEECLCEVRVPLNLEGHWGYEKLRIRKALDFPSLGIALRLQGQAGRRELSVCLTGVDTHPSLLKFSESDHQNEEDFLSDVETCCMKSVAPIKQDFFSPRYRREMIPVLIRRWLKKLS